MNIELRIFFPCPWVLGKNPRYTVSSFASPSSSPFDVVFPVKVTALLGTVSFRLIQILLFFTLCSQALWCIRAIILPQKFLHLLFHKGAVLWFIIHTTQPSLLIYKFDKRQSTLGTGIHHACLHKPDLCLPFPWPPSLPSV